MMNDSNYASVELSSPTEESLPPYESSWGRDVEEKEEKKRWKWQSRKGCASGLANISGVCNETVKTLRGTTRAEWIAAYQNAPHAVHQFLESTTNGEWSKTRLIPSRQQLYAFLLLLILGVLPMALLGFLTVGDRPFQGVFQDKIQSCGYSFGTPENATVTGIEKLFVLDRTFGQFTFSAAKTIDVAWDVLIGRGVQLLAWWVGYIVFSDALLRAIERHPASFQLFQRIALEGPSLLSLWTLIKELWCAKSKQTKVLFFYMWMSTLYIITIPMFLSAMTGYDSTSIPWVSLDDSNNIVPAATLQMSVVTTGPWNETWKQNACLDYSYYSRKSSALYLRRQACDCQFNNGTIVNATTYANYQRRYYYSSYSDFTGDCKFDYPGNNQTFTLTDDYHIEGRRGDVKQCAHSYNVTVNDRTFDLLNLNTTSGYCYDSKGYDYSFLSDRSRCLPDTANPTYQWGFSTMLSGVFVFFHFGWAISMYVVWQDAQWCSTLVKTGYTMTPLRAAFAMAKAAKRRTGMGEKQLVRADTKELKQELYGSKGKKGTKVEYGIFDEGGEEHGEVEVRRRHVNAGTKDGDETEMEEVDLGSGSASLMMARTPR